MNRKLQIKEQEFEIRFYEGVVKRSPNYVDALIPLAEAYTRYGLYEKGLEIDKRLSVLCKNNPIAFYNLACSFALVGKKRSALSALKQAIELGYRDFSHLRRDPDLKSLRGSAAFEKLIKQCQKPQGE